MKYLVLTGRPAVSPNAECTYVVHSTFTSNANSQDELSKEFLYNIGARNTDWVTYEKEFTSANEKVWGTSVKVENINTREWFALIPISQAIAFLTEDEIEWPPKPEQKEFVNWSWPL